MTAHGTAIDYTSSSDTQGTVSHALKRIEALEAENKRLKAELETMREALAGAHRIVRQIRDQDSTLSEVPIAPLDN